ISAINFVYYRAGEFKDKNFKKYITITFPQVLIVIMMLLYLFTLVQQYQYLQNCNNKRPIMLPKEM
ncbi:MAG: hypothetical protein O2871_03920, partial [bacterium]|nr:hypothetical protein [bacterium]